MLQCNTAGTHARHEMGGHSQVVDATGKVLAAAGLDEQVLSIDIDTAATPAWRRDLPRAGRPAARVSARRDAARCAPGSGCARPSSSGAAGSTPAAGRCRPRRPARSRRRARLLDLLLRQLPPRPRRAAPVEARFPDALTIIGVHSPKFEHEADADALAAAVERYAVHHPVLDDPELVTWQAYTARAWPTLVVIDPEGYVVASMSGEGHGPGLAALVAELIEEHAAKGTLQPGDDPYVPAAGRPTRRCASRARRSPCPTGRSSSPTPPTTRSCTSRRTCRPSAPAGVARMTSTSRRASCSRPPERGRAARRRPPRRRLGQPPGQGNPLLRRLDPRRGRHRVQQLRERTGRRARRSSRRCRRRGTSPGSATGSSSPWPAPTSCGRGRRATPSRTARVEVVGGTTNEGLVDGPARDAWFAQPSGLATSADGDRVWVADSETSALRSLTTGDRRRARRRDARRHRPVRLRPPRRRRRRGAAPAPARRHRAARRLGRGQRHLQRRDPPLRPGDAAR